MNRILDALRSPGAMMIALVCILSAQGEHTAQVIEFFSHSGGAALAYAFAVAIEVAVLLFVLNGHKRISYGFAVATFFTNVIYYAIGGVDLQSIALLPVLLLSVLPPAAIVGYSHTIAGTLHTPTPASDTPRRYDWQFWRKPLETPVLIPTSTTTSIAPIVQPGASGGHSEGAGDIGEAVKRLTPDQRRAQIAERELQTTIEVIQAFGIGKRTADADLAWVRKNVMHTNGVAK